MTFPKNYLETFCRVCQVFDQVTRCFHGNQVLTGRFTQICCFQLNFHEIPAFYEEFLPKSYIVFDFFKSNLVIF